MRIEKQGAIDTGGSTPSNRSPPSGNSAETMGAVAVASRPTCVTKALKAHLSFAETGDKAAQRNASAAFDRILEDHLKDVVTGGWRDRLSFKGAPKETTIPASTGHHVTLAFEELIRVAKLLT